MNRIGTKALLLVGHLLIGLSLALIIRITDLAGAGRGVPRERLARWWFRDLLSILRVRVHVRGAPLRGAHLTVSNHVSWLDIPVIGALEPTRFVSRHDVRDWPVAGPLAEACGTFYIHRGKGGARRALAHMTPHLVQGCGSVALFPEGTTSDGRGVLTFHARLFDCALQAQRSVQPVAMRYARSARGEVIAPFIGDMTLAGHVLRLLCEPDLHVEISYGSALVPDPATTRDGIAAQAQRWVESVISRGEFVPARSLRRRDRFTSGPDATPSAA